MLGWHNVYLQYQVKKSFVFIWVLHMHNLTVLWMKDAQRASNVRKGKKHKILLTKVEISRFYGHG